jgi:hypothetical protein
MACRKHYRAELLAGAASNQLVSSSLACSVGASDQSHCAGPQLSCGLTLLPCLHHQLLLPAHYCTVLYCTVDIILYFTFRGADTLISPLTRRNGVQRQTVLQSSPPPPPPAQQLHLHRPINSHARNPSSAPPTSETQSPPLIPHTKASGSRGVRLGGTYLQGCRADLLKPCRSPIQPLCHHRTVCLITSYT